METQSRRDDDDGGGVADQKLIPEWRVAADDQIVLAGLLVVLIMAGLIGWNAWRGGDELPAAISPVATSLLEAAPVDGDGNVPVLPPVGGGEDDGADDDGADDAGDDGEEQAAPASSTTTTTAPTTTTTAAPAGPSVGDVQAAVDPLPGDITGATNETVAVLTGFVANDAERREAEAAAAAVDGVTEVDNQLVILEPDVLAAVRDRGVAEAEVVGEGTVMTVRGMIDSEDERADVLADAAAVDGVTEVIDALELSVTADLNELPQVQFAYATDEILAESSEDLDAAAELLLAADGVNVEIQGYTDVEGTERFNLRLSQERADAVRERLIEAGVDPDTLTAVGYGETTEFGPDLESNRLVRFAQIDG
ncbi:MAG: OmpA family protein [Actinomycetota bacterium]